MRVVRLCVCVCVNVLHEKHAGEQGQDELFIRLSEERKMLPFGSKQMRNGPFHTHSRDVTFGTRKSRKVLI